MNATRSIHKKKAPDVSSTKQGYQYVRCQRGDRDDTVYIHQLCAIAGGHDPYRVFSDAFDVHHRRLDRVFDLDEPCPPTPYTLDLAPDHDLDVDVEAVIPPIDTPEAVELQPRSTHRAANLPGDRR